jgi:diguanylate cyclase (GGDEF)-like protein
MQCKNQYSWALYSTTPAEKKDQYIMDVMARERSRSDRSGNAFSLLLFDLDHFKRINDRYGHVVGDQILSDFARSVKSELRGMDSINTTDQKRSFGRYGGEEFIAILPGTDLLGAHRCAERIREIIASQNFRNLYTITTSVGVAEYQRGETVPQLLTRADQALYQAKRDGRNLVRCSERPMEKHSGTKPALRILK